MIMGNQHQGNCRGSDPRSRSEEAGAGGLPRSQSGTQEAASAALANAQMACAGSVPVVVHAVPSCLQ